MFLSNTILKSYQCMRYLYLFMILYSFLYYNKRVPNMANMCDDQVLHTDFVSEVIPRIYCPSLSL